MLEDKKAPIRINEIEFTPRDDCSYKNDYIRYAQVIADESLWYKALQVPEGTVLKRAEVERAVFRHLISTDLFFIVYFVIGIKAANHPFVVKMCREVEDGPKTKTLDIWARYHYKSSIITVAETVQYHLVNPEECTCIFSYKAPAAQDFLDSIRKTFEKPIIVFAFPEVVWEVPQSQAPSWSLQGGIVLKRKNTARKEATVEASGLVEGMVTGKHFERRIYDDVETADISESPDEMEKCFSRFEMSGYLGSGKDSDIERVIGTYYNHSGPLVRIRDKMTIEKKPEYFARVVPGTHDGTPDGKPVLMSEKMLATERTKQHFYSQIICDPTPKEGRKLNPSFLNEIEPELIPKSVIKFMIVDPAGEASGKGGSDWAVLVVGVEPKSDELGNNNVYLMQAVIAGVSETEAPELIVRMYLGAGIVYRVGVEKVAQSTAELHVANALEKRGRRVSLDDGSLVILKPSGRDKDKRILDALGWPLNNGKLYMSKQVPAIYRQRIRDEMDKFPYWKKDGIDAWSYIYDMIKGLNLSTMQQVSETRFIRQPYSMKTSVA